MSVAEIMYYETMYLIDYYIRQLIKYSVWWRRYEIDILRRLALRARDIAIRKIDEVDFDVVTLWEPVVTTKRIASRINQFRPYAFKLVYPPPEIGYPYIYDRLTLFAPQWSYVQVKPGTTPLSAQYVIVPGQPTGESVYVPKLPYFDHFTETPSSYLSKLREALHSGVKIHILSSEDLTSEPWVVTPKVCVSQQTSSGKYVISCTFSNPAIGLLSSPQTSIVIDNTSFTPSSDTLLIDSTAVKFSGFSIYAVAIGAIGFLNTQTNENFIVNYELDSGVWSATCSPIGSTSTTTASLEGILLYAYVEENSYVDAIFVEYLGKLTRSMQEIQGSTAKWYVSCLGSARIGSRSVVFPVKLQ